MTRLFGKLAIAGIASSMLLGLLATGASAESRNGRMMPSRQMMHRHALMHRPMMHRHSMRYRHMRMHRHTM